MSNKGYLYDALRYGLETGPWDPVGPLLNGETGPRGTPNKPCEDCRQTDQGSTREAGWYVCNACNYPFVKPGTEPTSATRGASTAGTEKT